ncbi:AraC family transcriptional regulator [Paenibacillus sp. PK3_47]|nr:AraC family transcriptional regulator [Paenibacillus sp. PK3_47]
MSTNGNLTGRLLQNITVSVTHAQVKSGLPGWSRNSETPAFNRLYYIESGTGEVIINGVTHYPVPGQLMIMPAGTTQTTRTSAEDPYTRYICHFDAKIGEWPLFDSAHNLYISDAADPQLARETFEQMVSQFEDNSLPSALRIQASLLNLLAMTLQDGGYSNFMEELVHNGDQGKLAHVLQYIELRLTEPMAVEELADLVHLHPNYFIPYFKKFMGVPPMQYVQLKRMDLAKRQLTYSDLSISDIAEQVGMELAHFSKHFKKTTGVSPSAYRSSTR